MPVFWSAPKPSRVNLNLCDNLACIVGTFLFSSCLKVHFMLKQKVSVWVACTVPYDSSPHKFLPVASPMLSPLKCFDGKRQSDLKALQIKKNKNMETPNLPLFSFFIFFLISVFSVCCVVWLQ